MQQKLKMKITKNVINYLPQHRVININKPGKVRVVFDSGATYNLTSLNESPLKGPDLLNSLIGVLTCFVLDIILSWMILRKCFTKFW